MKRLLWGLVLVLLATARAEAQVQIGCPPYPLTSDPIIVTPLIPFKVGVCYQLQNIATGESYGTGRVRLLIDGTVVWENMSDRGDNEYDPATGKIEYVAGPIVVQPGPHTLSAQIGQFATTTAPDGTVSSGWQFGGALTVPVNPVAGPPQPLPCVGGQLTGPVPILTNAANVAKITYSATNDVCTWKFVSDMPWATLTPDTGVGNGLLTLTTPANLLASPRVLNVSGPASMTLVQPGTPPPPPNPCSTAIPAITVSSSFPKQLKLGEIAVLLLDLRWTDPLALGSTVQPPGRRMMSLSASFEGGPAPYIVAVETPDGSVIDVAGLKYSPRVKGSYNLVIRAVDSAGCTGRTGSARTVTVN